MGTLVTTTCYCPSLPDKRHNEDVVVMMLVVMVLLVMVLVVMVVVIVVVVVLASGVGGGRGLADCLRTDHNNILTY